MIAAILMLLAELVPLSNHGYLEPWEVTARRYIALADAISRLDAEPLSGLTMRETKLLLAATAARESQMRADVMTCRVLGPRGARGAFQTELASLRDEACSLDTAPYAALRIMRWSFDLCRELPLDERLAGYCGGTNGPRCTLARWESRRRVRPALAHRNRSA